MAQLFDKHWQLTNAGNFDGRAVGRVVRTLVRALAMRGGYTRSEIFYMLMQEIDSELLKIAADKQQEIFVVPQAAEHQKNFHSEHCCIEHGCKYGDDFCPVYLGIQTQSFRCEDCGGDEMPRVTKEEIATRRSSLFDAAK